MTRHRAVFALLGIVILVGACSTDLSFQRRSTEVTDPKWTSFSAVKKSFENIQNSIAEGKTITVADLEYRGFGPGTNNATVVMYTALEDLFIGNKGERTRLPEDVAKCTQEKGKCYGLLVQISQLHKVGEESFFDRLLTKKKTKTTGWGFVGVFALLKQDKKDVVVAAYPSKEEANISRSEDGWDPRERVFTTLSFGSLLKPF